MQKEDRLRPFEMPLGARSVLLLIAFAQPLWAFGFGAKKKHEWTYDEFIRHKEHGHNIGAMLDPHMIEKMYPDSGNGHMNGLLQKAKAAITLTDEHHDFRAKEEHEKQAHYEEWVSTHKEQHEREQYEKTLKYKLYWAIFHWREGVVAIGLFVLKAAAVAAGIWCLIRHKAKRAYIETPNSPFRRSSIKKLD